MGNVTVTHKFESSKSSHKSKKETPLAQSVGSSNDYPLENYPSDEIIIDAPYEGAYSKEVTRDVVTPPVGFTSFLVGSTSGISSGLPLDGNWVTTSPGWINGFTKSSSGGPTITVSAGNSGYYIISFSVSLNTTRIIGLSVNGVICASSKVSASTSSPYPGTPSGTICLNLNAGDTISLYQLSAGEAIATGGTNRGTWFSAVKIA